MENYDDKQYIKDVLTEYYIERDRAERYKKIAIYGFLPGLFGFSYMVGSVILYILGY